MIGRSIGFKVPNTQAVIDRAVAAGYKPMGQPRGVGAMVFGMVSDRDGYTVEFVQAESYPR